MNVVHRDGKTPGIYLATNLLNLVKGVIYYIYLFGGSCAKNECVSR